MTTSLDRHSTSNHDATSTSAEEPPVENGWRSTTPDGDNVLLDFVRAEVRGWAAVTRAAGGRVHAVDELGLHMTDAGLPTPFGNIAHLTRPLTAAETPRLAEELRSFYGAGAGGPYFLFSPVVTEDLAPAGLHLAGHPPFMVRPAGRPTPATPSGLRIVRVTTPDALSEYERTIIEAYTVPEMAPYGSQPRLLTDALLGAGPDHDAGRWHWFVGYDGDRPVATVASFVTDRIVAVEAVSTRAECRGRGYGAAITAAATVVATDRPAALVASESGRPVYAALGYQSVLRYTLWVGQR